MRAMERPGSLARDWTALLLAAVLTLTLPVAAACQRGGAPDREATRMNTQLLQAQLDAGSGDAVETSRRLAAAALPVLAARTTAASTDERVLVVECFAAVGGEEASRALVAALSDPEIDVWNTALVGLHTCFTPGIVRPLLQLLRDSPHARVRGEIGRILGRIGDPAALVLLREQARVESDPEAVAKINLGVARLEDGAERRQVVDRLGDPDARVRYRAIGELEYVNDRGLLAHLRPLLADEAPVENVGQERWPVWHRVCDRAVEAVAVLSGGALTFPLGRRTYSAAEIGQARAIVDGVGGEKGR